MEYDAILAGLTKGIDRQVGEDARKSNPQLAEELARAIVACETSPLVPDDVADLVLIVDDGKCLRHEARNIRHDLPFLLRTSSAEKVAGLTERLWTCASLATEVAKLRSELARAVRLLYEFDDHVLELAEYVEEMAAETDI